MRPPFKPAQFKLRHIVKLAVMLPMLPLIKLSYDEDAISDSGRCGYCGYHDEPEAFNLFRPSTWTSSCGCAQRAVKMWAWIWK